MSCLVRARQIFLVFYHSRRRTTTTYRNVMLPLTSSNTGFPFGRLEDPSVYASRSSSPSSHPSRTLTAFSAGRKGRTSSSSPMRPCSTICMPATDDTSLDALASHVNASGVKGSQPSRVRVPKDLLYSSLPGLSCQSLGWRTFGSRRKKVYGSHTGVVNSKESGAMNAAGLGVGVSSEDVVEFELGHLVKMGRRRRRRRWYVVAKYLTENGPTDECRAPPRFCDARNP